MTWQARAKCRGTEDPELWYSNDAAEIAQAKAICADCPVRLDCLDAALLAEVDVTDPRSRHGVWGGLTGPERALLATQAGTVTALTTALTAPISGARGSGQAPDHAAVYRRISGDRAVTITTPERLAVVHHLWAEGLTDHEIARRTGIGTRQVLRDRRRLDLPSREARSA